jgi:hypothetical protein
MSEERGSIESLIRQSRDDADMARTLFAAGSDHAAHECIASSITKLAHAQVLIARMWVQQMSQDNS